MAEVERRHVAVVLPPREGFGPQSAGAIALLQARLADPGSAPAGPFAVTVLGARQDGPVFPLPYVPVLDSWWPPGSDARYAAGLRRALLPLRPALIEVHNRPDLARRLAAWFPPQRIALFLHNDPRGMRGAKTAAHRSALSRRLGAVVCVSAFLARCWTEGTSGLPAPRVLPNCLDLCRLPPALAPEQRAPRIVFAGRLVADKGADSFVAACAEALPLLPGWEAVMIGADRFRPDSPETPFTEALRPRAQAAGVRLLGYQDHESVMVELSRAAIAVLPSRWQEPFGLAALEAMANGAALIATRRGGLAELTEDVSVPIEAEDVAGIAQAIVGLARDPKRRASLSQAGLERARAYDLPAARRQLDQLRMELLRP
ncbi:MAG TPA: glycosyltransferase family 4 protein [Acidisoma sp.]|uniref:glycosyltransferase family 4 protein n=1 Tax=Acidisoma sp. TaxID=1872115 RepID=UPI002CA111B1|nr:glycosyltransferase family 4 protein [Acidisoma sp.]HTI01131.1 glycosyltransferase family 4 protein [Acidisoma sp.]